MATKKKSASGDIEDKLKQFVRGDLGLSSRATIRGSAEAHCTRSDDSRCGSKTSLPSQNFTIEDSARMHAAGIKHFDNILDEVITGSAARPDQDKLKGEIKKCHAKLKSLRMEDFEHTVLRLKTSPTLLSLESSSALSTNSSSSSSDGVLTGWIPTWSLESSGKSATSSRHRALTHGSCDSRPTIRCIKGGCFLRADSSVVVTEPRSGCVRVFSRKKANVLATIDVDECLQRQADWSPGTGTRRRFSPTGVCETETNGVVAVTDLNRLFYVRIAGLDSTVEAEIELRGRIDVQGVAYTNQSRMILLDTVRPFVGCYDSGGRLIREFKGNFCKPSFIGWNDYYQVAAIVDSDHRNVSFYDIDSKHLTTFSGSSHVNKTTNNNLSYPTGVCWTSHSQLLVADKANSCVLSFDFRSMKSEIVLDLSDGLRDPVVLACDRASKNLLVTEEEFVYGGRDSFRLKTFRRHGVPKNIHDSLFKL